MDENAQYFLLAVYWFATNPIAGKEEGGGRERNAEILFTYKQIVTLIPFFTFSGFHALGYIRANIIPNVFPTNVEREEVVNTWQAKTQQRVKSWTDKYYSIAMRFVAHSEVTIIAVRLALGIFR